METKIRITEMKETEMGCFIKVFYDILDDDGERDQSLTEHIIYSYHECDDDGKLNMDKATERVKEYFKDRGFKVV